VLSRFSMKRLDGAAAVAIPLPGHPVRGSRSGAPIMALLDLLGRRWAMGILWVLSEGGPLTFRALQERCETISPTVLSLRLKQLAAAGFVVRTIEGYAVTALGQKIYDRLVPLGETARTWADQLQRPGATCRRSP
jgi:DNA-binding HxlR family transcriptional regulator